MRSQKIRNKAPRPFKANSSELGWSGGNRNDALKPLARLVKPAVKKGAPPPAEASPTAPPPTDS